MKFGKTGTLFGTAPRHRRCKWAGANGEMGPSDRHILHAHMRLRRRASL
jgi:hypothetical protein